MRLFLVAAIVSMPLFVSPQNAPSSHVVIANLAKPGELDFEGGTCDRANDTMRCTFQQVLLRHATGSDTCEIITNRYDLAFQRQTATRWVSNEGPSGACGVIEITTVQQEPQGGGVLWTMTSQKIVTNKNVNDLWKAFDGEPREDLTWKDAKRPLPCKFIVPGLIQ